MLYRTIGTTAELTVSTLCLGTMNFGSMIDPETAFAILDRFRDAGGTFLDTANNYNAWPGFNGHGRESEDVIGAWLSSRRATDAMVVATKCGAGRGDPQKPLSDDPPHNYEGLAPRVIREQAQISAQHLGVDRIDIFYGHVDDPDTPLTDTVESFGSLTREGLIGVPGISNISVGRLVEARSLARELGVVPYAVVQQQGSYLYPSPYPRRSNYVTGDLLDYVQSTRTATDPGLTVAAYSPLHQGAFSRSDKPLYDGHDHANNRHRLLVLRDVAEELNATANQVALAWLLGGDDPIIPIIGPSTVEQLDELLTAVNLRLEPQIRTQLDQA